MHTDTVSPARSALRAHVAAGTTAELVASALALDNMAATPTSRVAGAEVVEELVRRFPDTIEALDVWSMDLDGELSLIETLVASIPREAIR